jgi:hypothetical protein
VHSRTGDRHERLRAGVVHQGVIYARSQLFDFYRVFQSGYFFTKVNGVT